MPRYNVELTCTARDVLRAWIEVEAASPDEAAELALAHPGPDWKAISEGEPEEIGVDDIVEVTDPAEAAAATLSPAALIGAAGHAIALGDDA